MQMASLMSRCRQLVSVIGQQVNSFSTHCTAQIQENCWMLQCVNEIIWQGPCATVI